MLRQRVMETPLYAPPRWHDCADFDLDFHMRRTALPADGSFADVLELARLAQMEDFEPRPAAVEDHPDRGTAGRRSRGALRLSPCTLRRGGRVQIAMTLFGLTEFAAHDEADRVTPTHSVVDDYAEAARYGVGLRRGRYRCCRRGAATARRQRPRTVADRALGRRDGHLGLPDGAPGQPRRVGADEPADAAATARRARHTDAPTTGGGPPRRGCAQRRIRRRGGRWVTSLPRAARRRRVLTAPDHADHLRTDDDAPGGNRITVMRFDIPVGESDPATRIQRIREITTRVRHEKSLPHTQLIAGVLNRVPRWYIGSILRHVDFLCSDVPGIPVPVSLGGSKVLKQYAFGPTIGAAVNVTLLTYVDTCALGVDIDAGAVPDLELFMDCYAKASRSAGTRPGVRPAVSGRGRPRPAEQPRREPHDGDHQEQGAGEWNFSVSPSPRAAWMNE